MMKNLAILALALAACDLFAGKPEPDGVKAAIERRRMMPARPRPERQIVKDGAILSLYADGSISTQAVQIVRMSASTKKAIDKQLSDAATLASAKALAARLRKGHGKAAAGLADADLVDAAEQVLDTTGRDAATAGVIGALFGAAAAAAAGKGKDKNKSNKTNKEA